MWHVHGKTYDFTSLMDIHPGGKRILEMTKDIGDVSALYETYHAFSDKSKIDGLLETYEIKSIPEDSNEKFDFVEYRELISLVKETLKTRKDIKATNFHWFKIIVLLFLYVLFYHGSLYNDNICFSIKCINMFFAGFFATSLSFNIMHDASHYSLSLNPKINEYFSDVWNAVMMWNSKIWFYHHVYAHHSFTMLENRDPDLLHLMPFFAKEKTYKSKTLFTSQNPYFYAFPVLVLFPGFFVGQVLSYLYSFIKGRFLRVNLPKTIEYYSPQELFLIFFTLFNLWYGRFIESFIFLISANLFYHLNIFANHDTYETMENKYSGSNWLRLQICNSGNFVMDNMIWTHLFGGINYQIEHHLFPNMSHIKLIEISPIVKQFCKERNISYVEHSITSAYLSFLKMLKFVNS